MKMEEEEEERKGRERGAHNQLCGRLLCNRRSQKIRRRRRWNSSPGKATRFTATLGTE
jgi:hypothetical protein